MKVAYVNGIFNETCIQFDMLMLTAIEYCRAHGYKDDLVYDPSIEGHTVLEAVKIIKEYSPNLLVISSKPFDCKLVSSDRELLFQFLRRVKEYISDITILVCGQGPSLRPDAYLIDEVDAIVIGEYEITLCNIMDKLSRNKDIFDIYGIAYRKENILRTNKPSSVIEDIDDLPFAARDTLVLLEKIYGNRISVPITGSRGCYMNCSFCISHPFSSLQNKRAYKCRTIKNIVDEMEYLNKNYNVTRFELMDDTFIPYNKDEALAKITEFCSRVADLNIKNLELFMQLRVDNYEPALICSLMEIGLNEIYLGVESFNQTDLDFYNKRISVNQIIDALDSLNNIGFGCAVDAKRRVKIGFINFHPYTTRSDLQNNLKYLKKYNLTPKKYCSILYVHYGTDMYVKLSNEKLIDKKGDIIFIDSDIRKIYIYSKKILDDIMRVRERVRICNKMYAEFQIGNRNEELNQLRIELDELCYEAYGKLLEENVNFETVYQYYHEKLYEYVLLLEENKELIHLDVIKF